MQQVASFLPFTYLKQAVANTQFLILRYELCPEGIPLELEQRLTLFDMVMITVGNGSNPLINKTTPGLNVTKYGNIVADESGKTSREGLWAGGDIVIGAATSTSQLT